MTAAKLISRLAAMIKLVRFEASGIATANESPILPAPFTVM